MNKMGKVIPMTLGKLDKKALLRYVEDSIKQLDKEQDKLNPREFEIARKTLRHLQKRIRKANPNEVFTLAQPEYDYLKLSLEQIVTMNRSAFEHMFFLKRWFYKLMAKNYEHLLEVVRNKKS